MSAKQTPNQAFNLNQQLDRYFLACSALVGMATLSGTQNSSASIVYSGIQNVPIPATNGFGGMYIDIDGMTTLTPTTGGGAGAALLPTWDLNPYRGGSSGADGGFRLKMGYSASTYLVYSKVGTTNVITPFAAGITIDGSQPLGQYVRMIAGAGGTGDWLNKTNYMGVQFQGNLGGTFYGWVQIATGLTGGGTSTTGGPGFPARVIDWAYENTGSAIVTGDIGAVPEPSSIALGCLAAGALGVSVWRKRKQSA